MFKKEMELREKIKDLEREVEYQEKEALLEIDRIRVEEHASQLELTCQLRQQSTKCEELKKRWDESIQKQQSDLIKALAVKLPTLNISDLHAHKECK